MNMLFEVTVITPVSPMNGTGPRVPGHNAIIRVYHGLLCDPST